MHAACYTGCMLSVWAYACVPDDAVRDHCHRCVYLLLSFLSGITAPVVFTLTLRNICFVLSFPWLLSKISFSELFFDLDLLTHRESHRERESVLHLRWRANKPAKGNHTISKQVGKLFNANKKRTQ